MHNRSITHQELLNQILLEHNVPTPSEALSGDQFLRWGKNNRYSAKRLGEDGVYFHDYVDDVTINRFFGQDFNISEQEREDRKSRILEAKKRAEAERESEYLAIADDVAYAWECSSEEGQSSYLQVKQVGAYGIRYQYDQILVPLRDITGKIYSLQYIHDPSAAPLYLKGGNKEFYKGSKKKGCFHTIGDLTIAEQIVVCEGYATGATLHEITGLPIVIVCDAGNLLPVIEQLTKRYCARLIIAADNDKWKEHNTGIEKANEAAEKFGCIVVAPDFPEHYGEHKPTDWNDLYVLAGPSLAKQEFEKKLVSANIHFSIKLLAQLPELEYALARTDKAKELGINVTILDKQVRSLKKTNDASGGIFFPNYKTWLNKVDLAQLLEEIATLFRKHTILPEHGDTAIALWVTFTWLIDKAEFSPILAIVSPEKGCGKTTVISILEKVVYRSIASSSLTPATVFRIIEAHKPTLLIDEGDTFLKASDELRGILNCGHSRATAYIMRSVGDDFVPTRFSTWGAKSIALIGRMADTLHDRSIIISLRKKLPTEKIERIRNTQQSSFEEVQSKLFRLKSDSKNPLIIKWQLPEFLSDRACDNWEPLLAIAYQAGKPWYKKALLAALHLSGNNTRMQGLGVELLGDIATVFERTKLERIFTAHLLNSLHSESEWRWSAYNNGRAITPRQVANYLSGFGIKSGSIRIGDANQKGYLRADFEDSFKRYLHADEETSVTTSQTLVQKELARAFGADCDVVTEEINITANANDEAYVRARVHFSGINIIPPPVCT